MNLKNKMQALKENSFPKWKMKIFQVGFLHFVVFEECYALKLPNRFAKIAFLNNGVTFINEYSILP